MKKLAIIYRISKNNQHNQPGDPDKGGRSIVETIERDDCPKRLLLGSDAVRIVSEELADRISEIQAWRERSVQSDY